MLLWEQVIVMLVVQLFVVLILIIIILRTGWVVTRCGWLLCCAVATVLFFCVEQRLQGGVCTCVHCFFLGGDRNTAKSYCSHRKILSVDYSSKRLK